MSDDRDIAFSVTPRIILASASPRRRDLLARIYPDFDVEPSPFAEPEPDGEAEDPREWVQALAHFKARAVAEQRHGRWVLGADTIVVCNGRVLGKPKDRENARQMLELQAKYVGEVLTGICLVRVLPRETVTESVHGADGDGSESRLRGKSGARAEPAGGSGAEPCGCAEEPEAPNLDVFRLCEVDVTRVWMRDDAGEREAYLQSGDWEGKAGAYGIQDLGDRLVERIEGSFTNVVGLPLERLERLLAAAGLPVAAAEAPNAGGKRPGDVAKDG